MFEQITLTWFLVIFVALVPISYRALQALNFGNLFQRNSTWQIKFLLIVISISLAFLVAFAVLTIFREISAIF